MSKNHVTTYTYDIEEMNRLVAAGARTTYVYDMSSVESQAGNLTTYTWNVEAESARDCAQEGDGTMTVFTYKKPGSRKKR